MRARTPLRLVIAALCSGRKLSVFHHVDHRRCPEPMRQELSCQENAAPAEERQTEGILECQANIVANGHRKRADQSRTERAEGLRA